MKIGDGSLVKCVDTGKLGLVVGRLPETRVISESLYIEWIDAGTRLGIYTPKTLFNSGRFEVINNTHED